MLKLFNDLKLFFEDNYRRIHIREYARLRNISPPSASKLLKNLRKEKILNKEIDKGHVLYYANRDNAEFVHLQRIYWRQKIEKTGTINFLNEKLISPIIILYGSFAKAEISKNSDIDIAVFTPSENELPLQKYEKKINRKIHLIKFSSMQDCKNENLLKNILNGCILFGRW
ncbi:nucleotidyltransferase domain-containing protein [Candidatus Woesearchaeota archaeon]|nr:nucleotidyltransferase domain-containing protein [Candidatus Woesearchaeota archaeon]